jgi:hypothetical protein|tara:strand:- start:686 stop:946 length:261 start_codon:yes stop_codon:yes gene_type:complete
MDPVTRPSTLTEAEDTLWINAFKIYFSDDPELESFELAVGVDSVPALVVPCLSDLLSPDESDLLSLEDSDDLPDSDGLPEELPFFP